MSASMRPTRCPRAASATAMFTATVDFPTPPFPELTAITRPSLGISPGCGAGIWPVDCGWDGGGPCVVRAGPAGSTTVILTPSGWTPSTALTALRASRTSVAGASRESRNVKENRPPGGTADTAGGEEMVVEPGVPDAARGRGDPGFEGRGHEVKSTPPASLPAPAAGGAPRSPGGARSGKRGPPGRSAPG